MESISVWIVEWLINNPKYAMLITIISVARMVFKPLMTLLQDVIAATPSKVDDEWLKKMMESKGYKTVAWFVDYLLSIKLPTVKSDK